MLNFLKKTSALRLVNLSVLRVGFAHHKIFRAIIIPNPVNVVNDLVPEQKPANLFFSNEAMLQDSLVRFPGKWMTSSHAGNVSVDIFISTLLKLAVMLWIFYQKITLALLTPLGQPPPLAIFLNNLFTNSAFGFRGHNWKL